jgi:hypothetical protein
VLPKRIQLLPLKAGVSIMALGAYDRHGTPPTIIPCGLTYFSGHRFRSRVMIEFGEPIQFTSDLLPMFKEDKKAASGVLLERIERGLRNVTINVPSTEWMRCTHVARRLYQPKNLTLSVEQYLRVRVVWMAWMVRSGRYSLLAVVMKMCATSTLAVDLRLFSVAHTAHFFSAMRGFS